VKWPVFGGFHDVDTHVAAGTWIAYMECGRDRDVMGIARRTSTYVGVALLGGMVGAIFGLLVAPGPGQEIRRRMARQSIEDQERLLRQAEMGSDLFTDDFDLAASA
jgi:hypothetical protein